MRTLMPALQKATPAPLTTLPIAASLPKQQRETRIVKDMPASAVAAELAAWIKG
jgi:electron transfer flavoprotein beta subunit